MLDGWEWQRRLGEDRDRLLRLVCSWPMHWVGIRNGNALTRVRSGIATT
jgi:hypothetical protein